MSTDHPPTPESGEEPGPGEPVTAPGRGIASMPDLRPYYDIRQLAELKPQATTAGRALVRASGRLLRVLGRGSRILGRLLVGWLSGRVGSRGSALARLGVTAAAVYGTARLAFSHPAGPWIAAGGLLGVALLAGLGRLPGLNNPAPATPAKPAPGRQRGGMLGLFAGARRATPEAPAATPSAAPAEPPLTALIRELTGDDNGVHLAVLRPAMRERLPGLSGASDRALSDLLREAGFDPTKKFRARGVPGCAGVHRSQLPPLSPEAPPGHSPHHSPPVRPAHSPGAESGGEGVGERSTRGIRYVRDPELGPEAWRIEHDER